MKKKEREQVSIPGPAKSMYWAYLAVLAVVLYSGFYTFHIFTSGWRYPWSNALMRDLNWLFVWAFALISIVYLYYALIGRREKWNEPLGGFRVVLAVLAILFWFITAAINMPFGLLSGLVNAFGGVAGTWKMYEISLWILLLVNVIYLYARWATSARFPSIVVKKSE